jgi:hypothetical protein
MEIQFGFLRSYAQLSTCLNLQYLQTCVLFTQHCAQYLLSYVWYLNFVLCWCELRSSGYEAWSLGWGNGCYTHSKSWSCFQNTLSIIIVVILLNLYVDTLMVQFLRPDTCSRILKRSWIRTLTCFISEATFWTITSFGYLIRLRDERSAHRKVSIYIIHKSTKNSNLRCHVREVRGLTYPVPTLTLPSLQH